MNLAEILEQLILAARSMGAEKVVLSRFDAAATPARLLNAQADRIFPTLPVDGGVEVETPEFHLSDAVAPGWAIFVAGSSFDVKDLSGWLKKEEG